MLQGKANYRKVCSAEASAVKPYQIYNSERSLWNSYYVQITFLYEKEIS